MYEYNADVVRVIDGDTIVVNIDLGLNVWEMKRSIRLTGINAPEIKTPEGKESYEFLKTLVEGKRVKLNTVKDDKYGGRYDAYVSIMGVGLINQMLLDTGHAVFMKS